MATKREENRKSIIAILINLAKEYRSEGKAVVIPALESFILENKLATKNNATVLAVFCYKESLK